MSKLKDDKLGKEPEADTINKLADALRVRPQFLRPGAGPMIEEFADARGRVWCAYQAQREPGAKKPPAWAAIARAHGPEVEQLLRAVIDGAEEVSAPVAAKLAEPLRTTPAWLLDGEGDPPPLPEPHEPVPADKYLRHKPAQLIEWATTEGGEIDPALLLKLDNFRKAVVMMAAEEILTEAAMQAVRVEHDADRNPNRKTIDQWRQLLFQKMRDPTTPKKKPRAPKAPVRRAEMPSAKKRHAG